MAAAAAAAANLIGGKPLASPERGGPPLRFFIPAAFGRAGSEEEATRAIGSRVILQVYPLDQPKKAHHCQAIPRGTDALPAPPADNFESRCVSRSTCYLTPDCTSQLLPASAPLCTILIRLQDCPYPFSYSTLPFPFLTCLSNSSGLSLSLLFHYISQIALLHGSRNAVAMISHHYGSAVMDRPNAYKVCYPLLDDK